MLFHMIALPDKKCYLKYEQYFLDKRSFFELHLFKYSSVLLLIKPKKWFFLMLRALLFPKVTIWNGSSCMLLGLNLFWFICLASWQCWQCFTVHCHFLLVAWPDGYFNLWCYIFYMQELSFIYLNSRDFPYMGSWWLVNEGKSEYFGGCWYIYSKLPSI